MNEDILELKDKEIKILKSIYKIFTVGSCSDYAIDKYIKKYTPEDILMEREERVFNQQELIEKYKSTLITIRVNYPGINKNNYVSFGIIKELSSLAVTKFEDNILYKSFNITAEGPIVNIIIDRDPIDVKYGAVDMEENHLLGRCIDIDVYDKNGIGLSRRELGMQQRKCYICGDIAQNCVRCQRHGLVEIKEFLRSKYENYCEIKLDVEETYE